MLTTIEGNTYLLSFPGKYLYSVYVLHVYAPLCMHAIGVVYMCVYVCVCVCVCVCIYNKYKLSSVQLLTSQDKLSISTQNISA